jgi:hypothetical protein
VGQILVAETEIGNIWRDDPYLVVRDRISRFPPRCIICGNDQNCRTLSCKVRKRPGGMEIAVWSTGIFSRSVTIKPYICERHRSPEVRNRIIGYLILVAGIGSLVAGFVMAISKHEGEAMIAMLVSGPCLIWGWVFYRVFRGRLLYANYIKDRVGWIENVHESILRAAPPLPP